MTEPLNANGKCKDCRKLKYCKKPCTQARRRLDAYLDRKINEAIASTPVGRTMLYAESMINTQSSQEPMRIHN